jgi:hypothetical protein
VYDDEGEQRRAEQLVRKIVAPPIGKTCDDQADCDKIEKKPDTEHAAHRMALPQSLKT